MRGYCLSSRSSRPSRSSRLLILALPLSLAVALIACGGDEDPDGRALSSLGDAELIAACDAEHQQAGAPSLTGLAHFTCYGASQVGGSCNATIYENCVAAAAPACAAPAATSPLRTCQATVGQARTCMVAFLAQFSAYQAASCAAPPTPAPAARSAIAACAEFCGSCPDAC